MFEQTEERWVRILGPLSCLAKDYYYRYVKIDSSDVMVTITD
jgi:hypothetical protein